MSITEEQLAQIAVRLERYAEGFLLETLHPICSQDAPALLAELRATREQRDGAIRLNDTYQQDCNALAAQVAALTAERDGWERGFWRQGPRIEAEAERAEAAEAREAALRAALIEARDDWLPWLIDPDIHQEQWAGLRVFLQKVDALLLATAAAAATTEGTT